MIRKQRKCICVPSQSKGKFAPVLNEMSPGQRHLLGGSEVYIARPSSAPLLDEDECPVSRSDRFAVTKGYPGNDMTGGCVSGESAWTLHSIEKSLASADEGLSPFHLAEFTIPTDLKESYDDNSRYKQSSLYTALIRRRKEI
jgi:hypothetical protein